MCINKERKVGGPMSIACIGGAYDVRAASEGQDAEALGRCEQESRNSGSQDPGVVQSMESPQIPCIVRTRRISER